jgi:hypothetical protein
MGSLVVDVRVVQHGLRRDTANVQAGATKSTTLLNTGNLKAYVMVSKRTFFNSSEQRLANAHLEARLSSLDGSRITTRTSTNDDNVIFIYMTGIVFVSMENLIQVLQCRECITRRSAVETVETVGDGGSDGLNTVTGGNLWKDK